MLTRKATTVMTMVMVLLTSMTALNQKKKVKNVIEAMKIEKRTTAHRFVDILTRKPKEEIRVSGVDEWYFQIAEWKFP